MKCLLIILIILLSSCGSLTTTYSSKPIRYKTPEQMERHEVNKKTIKLGAKILGILFITILTLNSI